VLLIKALSIVGSRNPELKFTWMTPPFLAMALFARL
jgi:hypothetical protein